MPELPDVSLYVRRLTEMFVGETLIDFKIASPFVLRSVGVSPKEPVGKKLTGVSRLGKRIVLEFEEHLYVIVHLMIAGRFIWREGSPTGSRPSKTELCSWVWEKGVLVLNEASPKKRAGIWIVKGEEGLDVHRRAGIDVLSGSQEEFQKQLSTSNRTLKRALTDPSSFDGIGNAYSDEILFRAKLSPLKLTNSLTEEERETLFAATRSVLQEWIEKLQRDIPGFPKSSQVTAFHKEFNVHGKYGEACQVCGAPVQRIVGQDNEMNYCAKCQNGGKLLADRSLSRLLKDAWPKTIEELML